ncbi:hypothetical protein BFGS084_01028 [Bacteroides fragilis]|nr:hypothetical protein BFGS084_01028 [Bacteroides fragilis]
MQKSCCIISLMAMFLMFFISCTNEELLPHDPDGPVLNQGRVVFNVNTGKSMVYTRASADDEQAIRSLGVFIVKPDGNLAEGVTRFYEAKDLIDKKLAVSIPVDIMETPGVKAYLVANGPDKAQCDGLKTGQEVLGLVATTKPEEISTKGIPMASGAISLNFTGGIATVDANMKRVMSTLCAKVVKSKGVVVGPSDFTFKVHGVSGKEGYCFKDECKDTGVEQVWNSTSKSQDEEVSLGYFYQSKAFQVEVISQSAGQSRTVEIPLGKAQTRNKKYVLKIHPKPASEGKGEFNVTVEAWDAIETDINFEKLALKKDLPADKFEIHDNEIWLLTDNYSEASFGSPKDWFVLKEGTEIVDVQLEGTIDEEKRGVVLKESGVVCATSRLNHVDLLGKIIVAVKDKNGLITLEDYIVHVSPANAWWRDDYEWTSGEVSVKVINGVAIFKNVGQSVQTFSYSLGAASLLQGRLGYGNVIDFCPWEPISSEKPQAGYLHDREGNVISGISLSFSAGSHYIGVGNMSPNTNVYGYVKVIIKDGELKKASVLKINFE